MSQYNVYITGVADAGLRRRRSHPRRSRRGRVMDWADLRNAAAEAKPFHRPGGVDPASAWVDAERLTALLADRDAQAVIAEAAREYVRIGYAMGDCSGNILPLLKAQSAAYDALVAAVDAERHP